jgi:hypothetical protein
VEPWLDEDKILPGQDWNLEITTAVRKSDVVIVCLSHSSVTKEGYVQKEIKLALDVADEKPDGTIFIIPMRLEECSVPERLRQWHWVDAFDNASKPYEKLGDALDVRANKSRLIQMPVRHTVNTKAPELKYFYYISRPKIDMIGPQLGMSPVSSPADVPWHTLEIARQLENRGSVRSIESEVPLETNAFYKSTSVWRHGLYYFRTHDIITVSYIMWATHRNYLILLVGSPYNILGEKVARDGIFVPGTSGAIDAIHQLLDSMRVDEPHYAEREGPDRNQSGDPFPDIKIERDKREDEYGVAMNLALAEAHVRTEDALRKATVPGYESEVRWQSATPALPIAVLCASHFSALPEQRLEILFRVFSKYSSAKKNLYQDLVAMAREPQLRSEIQGLNLRKYNAVYVGSPVYTAIA